MREKRVRHSALVHKLCRRYRWIDSPSYNYEDFVQDAMFSAWRSTRDESSLTCAPSTAVGYAVIRAAQHNIGRMLMPVKLPRKVTANRYWRAPEPEVSSEQPASKVALGPRLLAALEALPEKERAILRMRYVLGYTLEEVGAEYGITRERVRQIESRALGRIRAAMAAGERRGAP